MASAPDEARRADRPGRRPLRHRLRLSLATPARASRQRPKNVGSASDPVLREATAASLEDEIGEILQPDGGIAAVGERPGLGTADGLSAYLCCAPPARHHRLRPNADLQHPRRAARPPTAGRRHAVRPGRCRQRTSSDLISAGTGANWATPAEGEVRASWTAAQARLEARASWSPSLRPSFGALGIPATVHEAEAAGQSRAAHARSG